MPGPTPRQLAREETIRRIKALALDQLAKSGAGELSLRAIARELNLVSSAIYRYYRSRDELLTALIVDAYDNLAAVLESAGAGGRRTPRRRWREVCLALRSWARAEPHRFALIYGSPIPGYRAPEDTIAPAANVVRALAGPADGVSADSGRVSERRLHAQLVELRTALEVDLDDTSALALAGAFARLIGLLTLELGGHLVGTFEPADDLYAALVEQEADALGL